MRNLRRATLPLVVALTAVGMTACQDSDAPATDAGGPTSAPAERSAAPSTKDDTASSPTSSASDGGSSESDGKVAQVPSSKRPDSKDTSSLDAETSALPPGPMTKIGIVKLGGYGNKGGEQGTFYAVLKVDSTGPGLVDLEYVMLDASGKELGTAKDNISVGGTKGELKVTRALGDLPAADKGKVAKVRLRVVKNADNSYATVTHIDPKISSSVDPASKTPLVTGRYKTDGKASVTSLNAICSDAKGRVVADNSPVKQIKASTWTPYKVSLFSAPDGYKPAKCYVGS